MMAWGRPRPSVSSDRARRVEISGYRGRASSRNFRFSSAGVMLALRVASTGVMRLRRMARSAHSTLREGWYLMAKMAMS